MFPFPLFGDVVGQQNLRHGADCSFGQTRGDSSAILRLSITNLEALEKNYEDSCSK